jgi:hypothetical protein
MKCDIVCLPIWGLQLAIYFLWRHGTLHFFCVCYDSNIETRKDFKIVMVKEIPLYILRCTCHYRSGFVVCRLPTQSFFSMRGVSLLVGGLKVLHYETGIAGSLCSMWQWGFLGVCVCLALVLWSVFLFMIMCMFHCIKMLVSKQVIIVCNMTIGRSWTWLVIWLML